MKKYSVVISYAVTVEAENENMASVAAENMSLPDNYEIDSFEVLAVKPVEGA